MSANRVVEVLVDDGVFCESPRWHDGALWFSDIGDDKVWRLSARGLRELVVSGIRMPSGLGWTRAGELLVTSIHDSAVYKRAPGGAMTRLCGPEEHGAIGTNDMATLGGRSYVSCAGREYASGDTLAEISAPVGKVILFDQETGAARIVADGYRMPNGIVVTPDGGKLIFSELWASRLLQFDIESDGSLVNEKVFAALDGHADGICLDAEGAIWAAVGRPGMGGAWQRLDQQGRVIETIAATDGFNAIASWLGGEDGRDLFLVANRMDSPEDLFNRTARSRILKTRVDVPGPDWR